MRCNDGKNPVFRPGSVYTSSNDIFANSVTIFWTPGDDNHYPTSTSAFPRHSQFREIWGLKGDRRHGKLLSASLVAVWIIQICQIERAFPEPELDLRSCCQCDHIRQRIANFAMFCLLSSFWSDQRGHSLITKNPNYEKSPLRRFPPYLSRTRMSPCSTAAPSRGRQSRQRRSTGHELCLKNGNN